MENSMLVNNNVKSLKMLNSLVFSVTDKLINMDVVGLIKKPSTGKELNLFHDSMTEILSNKLRDRLGV